MTEEQLKTKKRNRANYLKNRDRDREKNKEKSRLWYSKNSEKAKKQMSEYRKSKTLDGYALYYIPKHNYIGITNRPDLRASQHKHIGKDVSRFTVLTTYTTKREALDAEKYMHNLGFKGENKTQFKTK